MCVSNFPLIIIMIMIIITVINGYKFENIDAMFVICA